jgi:ABC-type multidrug transport system fused ATPase/permease subunit
MNEAVRAGSVQAGPLDEYQRRLRAHEEQAAKLKALHLWLGWLRLATVVLFLGVAWFTIFLSEGPRWCVLIPIVLFVGLGVWQGGASRRLSSAQRAAEIYRRGIARVEDRWIGLEVRETSGLSAEVRARLAASLYAGDLDVVGRGGMFELLCRARTRMGEEALLTWLLEPAEVPEVLRRQAAVEELRGRVDLRERMGVTGETAAVGVQAEALREWAAADDVLTQRWMPWVAGLLAVLFAVLAATWIWLWLGGTIDAVRSLTIGDVIALVLVVLVAEKLVRRPFETRITAVLDGTDAAVKNMQLLASLLEVMEAETFASERLVEIKQKLASHTIAGSVAIGKLGKLGQWSDSMDNLIVKGLNTPLMYSVQVAWAIQRWRRQHGGAVRLWLEAVAEMEALLSLAMYAYEHPADVFPEFVSDGACVDAEEMGHPLIAAAKCVRNSLRLGAETRVLLISGSNMSGKSTLMRTLGVNTVLAMCGAPVRAKQFRLTPLTIGASLLLNDSLQEGHSRFYAEIEKLGRICSLAEGAGKDGMLFLLDELLQGTNSKDRLVGAEGVVRALVEAGAIGMVTTHDLALADMEGLPQGAMRNMHFQDQIVEGQMRFDFTLREGVAMKSNGVELMRLIGLKV